MLNGTAAPDPACHVRTEAIDVGERREGDKRERSENKKQMPLPTVNIERTDKKMPRLCEEPGRVVRYL